MATRSTVSIAVIEAYFDWLSDSSAFLGATGGCGGDPVLIGLDGSISKPFSEGGRQAFMDIDWNTDRMYYTSDPCWSPNTQTRVYDPSTGQRFTIQAADGRSEGGGTLSPDGSSLCYMKHDFSYRDPAHIWVMNVDGSGDHRVTVTTGLRDMHPVFSPDGSQIVFTRLTQSSPGASEIWVVGVDGSGEVRLADDSSMNRTMGWAVLHQCTYSPEAPFAFEHTRGAPRSEIRIWESCGGPGSLVIANEGAAAAWVFLNGELVLGPTGINRGISRLELNVSLAQGENVVSVEVLGKPGSTLTLQFLAAE